MTEKREKRKKIFYVPGMISLVLIPLLCVLYFYKIDAFKVERAIVLVLPIEREANKDDIVNLRKYKVYKFNGNALNDRKKLDEMRFYLRKLINDKDSVNGIKLQYDVKTNYDVFIRTLDILQIEDVSAWGMFDNDIFIIANNNLHQKKAQNFKGDDSVNCGTAEVMAQQANWERKNKKEEEESVFQATFFKQKWKLIFCGYFPLVLINIFALVKFNKNKKYNQK